MSSASSRAHSSCGVEPGRRVERDERQPAVRHAPRVPRHEPDALDLAQSRRGRRALISWRRSILSGSDGQLAPADRGEQVGHAVVEPDLGVLVVQHRLAGLLREVPGAVDRLGVADEHAAAAGGHDLVAVERVSGQGTPRSGVPALPGGADRLGGVLDQRYVEATTDLGDAVELCALAVQVHDDDGGRQPILGGGAFRARPRGAPGPCSRWSRSESMNRRSAPT